ncbi:MAG: hypothetical protein FWH11_02855 [Micrococcales bacterium]|nr:hypothetical protein [Micrococcales bacterium]
MKRVPTLDGLDLYRRIDSPRTDQAVNDPERVDAVVKELRQGVTEALATPTTVQGWRAQALFASMVVALDGCTMMTQVDLGEIFADGDPVKAPDFFLHLRDGRRILVDVKSLPKSIKDPVKFTKSEVARLRRFGELYGAEVHLALYFSSMSMWLLISIDDLSPGPGGGLRITMEKALMRNDMAAISDWTIGVEPPLELVLHPDPSSENRITEDGRAEFRVGSVEVRAGGRRVYTKEDQQIVWFLMMYGKWSQSEHLRIEGSKLVSLTWRAEPEERENLDQRFELVGSLASMYTQFFEIGTRGDAGIIGLDLPTEPGAMISLIPHDYHSDDLPLWRFRIAPRTDLPK